ncbi:MAG: hypothetical protein DMF37_05295, partial [Verrucomicrobia bacterium]
MAKYGQPKDTKDDWSKKGKLTQQEIGQTLKERWDIQPPLNCHTQVQKDNPKLEPVRQSWKTGNPIEWVWIHRTVDYVYYNHAAHVNRGISCFSCHGPVNHMPVVYMAKPHSMAWCLECHRHPENFLRPEDQVF